MACGIDFYTLDVARTHMSFSSIRADEQGVEKQRAEYVILRLLKEGPVEDEKIDNRVKEVHSRLLETDHESPFYFEIGGSNGPISDDLNEGLNRLLQYGKIDLTDENQYRLSEDGESYLNQDAVLERHGIDPEFRGTVDDILENN